MATYTKPPPVPTLYRRLPANAHLSTKEVAQLLGISPHGVCRRVADGEMPPPTVRRPTRNPACPACFWRVGVILAYVDSWGARHD